MKDMYKFENTKTSQKQNYYKVNNALKLIKSQTIKNPFAGLFSRIRKNFANLS